MNRTTENQLAERIDAMDLKLESIEAKLRSVA